MAERVNGGVATADAPGEVVATPSASIHLTRLRQSEITISLVGTSPVIPHKWAEKSLQLMRQKQFGQGVRPAREPKNPEEEAFAATYWMPDGQTPGIPASAFKASMVAACRLFEGLSMVQAKQLFYVRGEGPEALVPIYGTISMREDTPRNSNGQADLRYRNQISDWHAKIKVRFISSKISPESIIALVDAAGSGGVGDWRPSAPKSSTGTYGTWIVVLDPLQGEG